MATYKKFELNVAEWVEFAFDKSYLWPEPSGMNAEYVYEGKTIPAAPYWSFKLAGDVSWSVSKHGLAEEINAMLAGSRRLAIMKFPGQGSDKKHYHAISNGTDVRVFPLAGVPQRFAEFVGTNLISAPNPVPPGGAVGGSIPTSKPPSAPPSPRDAFNEEAIMDVSINDAVNRWMEVLEKAFAEKGAFQDEKYAILRQVAVDNIGATAHYLFRYRMCGKV